MTYAKQKGVFKDGTEAEKALSKHRASDTSKGIATIEYARYYRNVKARGEK